MTCQFNRCNLTAVIGSLRFVLGALILALGALFIPPGMRALADHYAKKPIEINRPFDQFDASRLPAFAVGWNTEMIPQPVEELGTDQYMFIQFVRRSATGELAEAKLFASYYSDPQDKVPHTPDVCYPPQGAVILKMQPIELSVPGLPSTQNPASLRYIELKWPDRNEVVIYCFCVEGLIRYDREQVRWIMGKPGNRHTYFGLIMVSSAYPHGESPEPAARRCTTLLTQALPLLINEHYPRESQVRRD